LAQLETLRNDIAGTCLNPAGLLTLTGLSQEAAQANHMREASAKIAFHWLREREEAPTDHDDGKRLDFVQKWLLGLMKLFSSNALLHFVEQILQGIKLHTNIVGTKQVLGFLPLALQHLGELASVTIPEGHQAVIGSTCREFYINRLLQMTWHRSLILPLACCLQDVTFTPTHLTAVVKKLIRGMESVDQQELPPLVYQLLLLSKQGAKRPILQGIAHFLARQPTEGADTASTIQLRTVQSTIILHISMGLKSDQLLAAELLKVMKTTSLQNPLALRPLNMALLLSTVRVQRLGDQVVDLLRSLIVAAFKDAERLQHTPWIECTYSCGLINWKSVFRLESIGRS